MSPPPHDPLTTLRDIRTLMAQSGRFISLSGLSGVAAGTFALLGAAAAVWYFDVVPFSGEPTYLPEMTRSAASRRNFVGFFLLDAGLVLVSALAAGIFFTVRRARRQGQPVWGPLTTRFLVNLVLPLVAGGIFCLALILQGAYRLVAPATLLFYGLALVNGGKYTLDDIRRLGFAEIALGLIASFLPGYGLEFWALGFGVLHVVYGIVMWRKYERV